MFLSSILGYYAETRCLLKTPPRNLIQHLLSLVVGPGVDASGSRDSGVLSRLDLAAAVVSWLAGDGLVALLAELAGTSGRQGGVGLALVGLGTVRVGLAGLHGTVVDVVSVGHDLDLVVGEFGQLGSDEGCSSLGDVRVGVKHIELLKGLYRVSIKF